MERAGGEERREDNFYSTKFSERRNIMGKRIFFFISLFILFTLCFSYGWAAEEPFPNRPIKIIVPMVPGGVMDLHAKILGGEVVRNLGATRYQGTQTWRRWIAGSVLYRQGEARWLHLIYRDFKQPGDDPHTQKG